MCIRRSLTRGCDSTALLSVLRCSVKGSAELRTYLLSDPLTECGKRTAAWRTTHTGQIFLGATRRSLDSEAKEG